MLRDGEVLDDEKWQEEEWMLKEKGLTINLLIWNEREKVVTTTTKKDRQQLLAIERFDRWLEQIINQSAASPTELLMISLWNPIKTFCGGASSHARRLRSRGWQIRSSWACCWDSVKRFFQQETRRATVVSSWRRKEYRQLFFWYYEYPLLTHHTAY